MRKIAFTLIFAGATFATEASSQVNVRASNVPPGQRPPAGMCRIWIDGVSPGRQPRATDCATARANAPANSRIIYGNDAAFPGRAAGRFNDGNCEFERRPSNLGDVFFGVRSSQRDRDCRVGSSRTREQNVWYPVGRDANGNVIYERRVRNSDGRVVVERARSTSGGNLERISSRRGSRIDRDTDRDSERRAGRVGNRDRDSERSKALEKARRDQQKAIAKAQRDREKAIERARRDADRNARGNNGKSRGNGNNGKGRGNGNNE